MDPIVSSVTNPSRMALVSLIDTTMLLFVVARQAGHVRSERCDQPQRGSWQRGAPLDALRGPLQLPLNPPRGRHGSIMRVPARKSTWPLGEAPWPGPSGPRRRPPNSPATAGKPLEHAVFWPSGQRQGGLDFCLRLLSGTCEGLRLNVSDRVLRRAARRASWARLVLARRADWTPARPSRRPKPYNRTTLGSTPALRVTPRRSTTSLALRATNS